MKFKYIKTKLFTIYEDTVYDDNYLYLRKKYKYKIFNKIYCLFKKIIKVIKELRDNNNQYNIYNQYHIYYI